MSVTEKIVYGLLVLSVFKLFFIEARFNPFKPNNSPTPRSITELHFIESNPMHSIRSQSLQSIPFASRQSIQPQRMIPAHSSNSLSSVSLERSPSIHSLNEANSPAIMRESMHNQAAISLNIGREQPAQRNIFQRIMPSHEHLEIVSKYLKNGAIASGGIGGLIVIGSSFSSKCEQSEVTNCEQEKKSNNIPIPTTTPRPEIYVPMPTTA